MGLFLFPAYFLLLAMFYYFSSNHITFWDFYSISKAEMPH